MAEAVIRNADDMIKFAKELQSYEEGVKTLCDKLKGRLDDAEQFMKDANSLKALAAMTSTFDEIKDEVPDCSEMADKLVKSAHYVREASETVRKI